ncbi:trichohyalin isoform X1 [Drosophila takahashii]|uniref:trichohyalin isoform X1 n=1 Tax=Drosophila takahashii TaxID=29030 RepID=UPI001CF87DA4|nr:trichohyalin [Drosophila takahashii]
MDLRMWRKILVRWIVECQFIDHNFITLEQSDIEAFFLIYIQNAQEAQEGAGEEEKEKKDEETEAEQAQPVELRSPLAAFLREHYPEFSAHMSSHGHLVSSDYVFVYTLLLQYACVKRPSMIFHSICQRLPAPMQQPMANLLDQTTKVQQLTRQNLRQIIANVVVEKENGDSPVSPCQPSSSISRSPEQLAMDNTPGSSSSSSMAATSPQPPTSTPQQAYHHRDRLRVQVSGSDMPMPAPSTPRTELLEQRTRELRGVRAQLEVVRYEKVVLEEQQMEKEELIKTLNKDFMATRNELAKLKNAAQNVEEVDVTAECTRNECDHLKRSLLREISQKEAIITESSDKLQDLYAEKSELAEQLRETGQSLLVCVDRIRDLEARLEELSRIASRREDAINSLERDKQELDRCLQEAREELHNRREVLNASSDLLNCSLSPNTTPENLASSVIDKQLREKEHENAELREELQQQNDSLLDLSEVMVGFLQRHNVDQAEVLMPVTLEEQQTAPSISTIKSIFLEAVEKATRLQEQCDSQAANIDELLQKSQSLAQSLAEQEEHLVSAKARIDELEQEAAEASRYHASELERRQKQCKNTREILEKQNHNLTAERDELERLIVKGDAHLDEIQRQLDEKEAQMTDLGVQIRELRVKNESLETRISTIEAERDSQESRLQQEQLHQQHLRSKYDLCRSQLNDAHAQIDDLTSQLNAHKVMLAEKLKEVEASNALLTMSLKLNEDAKVVHEKEQAKLQLRMDELSQEKEQLQVKMDELRKEKEQEQLQLKMSHQKEQEQLLFKMEELSQEKEHLQLSQKEEKEQLQLKINELSQEKEQAQLQIDELTLEKEQLQLSLKNEQEQLHSKFNELSQEKEQLQLKMDDLSQEKEQLQLSQKEEKEQLLLSLNNEQEQLNLKINELSEEKEKAQLKIEQLQLSLNNEQEQLQSKINDLSQEKEQSQLQLQLKINEKEQLQLTIDALRQQLSNLSQQTDGFLNRITGLIRGNNAVSSMVISSTGSGELSDRFEDIEALLKQQTLAFDTLETQVNDLLSQLAVLCRSNAEILHDSQLLVTKRNHDEQQRAQLAQTLELTAEKLRAEIDLQDAEIAMRDQQVAGMEKLLKKAMEKVEARLLKISPSSEFPGCTDVQSPQQIHHWMDHFFDLHDQILASRDTLESRYQANSKLTDQLARSKEQLEQQVQLLQDRVHANDQGPVVKQLSDTIANLEQVNDKLSKDNMKLHSLQLEMSQTVAKNASEVERRSTKIAQLEASDRRRSSDLFDCRRKQDEQKAELRAKDEKMAEMKEMYEKQIEELKATSDQRCKELEKETEGGNQDLLGNLKENEDKLAKQAVEHSQLLKATKEECELRCQELEKQLAQKDEEQSRLKTLEAECQQRCQELEKQLAEKDSQSANLVSEHETAVQFIKAELEEARYQENQMRIQDKELRQTIETHKQLLRESTSDLQDARLQEANLRQTIATHKQLMLEGGGSGGDSSEELSSLRSKLQEAEKRAEQLKTKLDKQTKELSKVKAAKQEEERKEQQQEELSELRGDLESAESRSAELQTLYDDATEEIISLSNKLVEEEKRAEQHKLELGQLKEQLAIAENSTKELLNKREEEQNLPTEVNAQLEITESSAKELLSLRYALVTHKLAEEQKLTEELKDELNKRHLELGTEASRRAELNVLYDSAQKELIGLRTKLQEEQKLRDQLEEELMQQQKQLSDDASKEELLRLQSNLQNEQTLTNELKEQLSKAQLEASRTAELTALYDRSEQELFRLHSKLEDEEKHTERLKRELKRQSAELANAENNAKQTQNQAELETRASNLSLERDTLQREIHLVKERLIREEREFQVKLATLEDDIETLEAQRDQMKAELSQATALIQEKDENICKLNEQLSKQQLEIDSQSKEMAETNRQLAQQANEVLELMAQQEQMKTELSIASALLQEKNENICKLKEQLETLEKQRDQMKVNLSDATSLIQEKDENILKLREQLEMLEAQQEQMKTDLSNATSLIQEKDENICKLKEQLSKQQLEIDSQSLEMTQTKRQLAEKADEVLELQERLAIVDELQQRLESEVAGRKLAQQQLAELNERLADVQQELDGTRLIHDACQFELEEKTREIEVSREEAEQRIRGYQERVEQLEQQVVQCNEELAELRLTNVGPSDLGATYSKADGPESDVNLGQLRPEEANSKLALDCQILQAKYRDAKDEIQRCEQKIKDQRLEMEGKLDKMKSKMRSLYTAEVTRMKEKQERDAAKSAAELEALTAQNAKYEEHTRKLSNQIVRLNEKVLEQQKQHAIISTKLRHLQMQPAVSEAKGISSSSAAASSTEDWQPFKRPNAPSSNLAMEDEEGEVFNNTYLTDLKLGRVPTDMTAEELIYRNSLQPPHLKSTYAAQYDLGSQDEDLKDGPHSLDDSMSALLSSSSTGARKKSMGTHYKRPGPPTPSKNGGRLSFGSSEPPREILREFGGDHHNHNSNTSKTPARFKFLTQRFSVGSSTLPRDELPQRKRSTLLTGIQRRRFRQAVGLFCTSTPRKSRSYYDQQRLIRASDAEVEEEEVEVEEEEEIMEEPGADQQGTPHLSTAALLALTKGNTRRLTNHGQAKNRKSRASLCLHGNIFCAKSRPVALKVTSSGGGKRLQQRRKLRQERMGRFDQARQLDQMYSPESPAENNNYSLHNRNEEQQEKPLMGQTMVLEKRSLAATFSVEQHSGETLEQLQFESENQMATTWAMASADETQEVWHFEQLCQETESTAPFQLQPLNYKQDELKLPQLVRSCSNITDASGTTNMTSTSSRGSCTTYSMASVHMTPIPHINITYVQPAGSNRTKSTSNRSLSSQCLRILGRLSLGERLIVGLALMVVMLGLFQLEHRSMVLALTVVLAAMVLILLTTRN